MKTNSSNQEPLKLSATERKHVLTIRAMSAERNLVVQLFARNLLEADIEAGTAKITTAQAKPEPTQRGHLSLVVDNGPVKPCA